MGDTLSPARCASGTAGKVGDFSVFPLKSLVVKRVKRWWLPFPCPHSAELCRAFWPSCKGVGAGSSVTRAVSELGVSGEGSCVVTERRVVTSVTAAVVQAPEVAGKPPHLSLLSPLDTALFQSPIFQILNTENDFLKKSTSWLLAGTAVLLVTFNLLVKEGEM